MNNENTAESCLRRLQSLLTGIEGSADAKGDIYRLSADFIADQAVRICVPVHVIRLTDFFAPGIHWHHYENDIEDNIVFSLMFPEVFRTHISGKVYLGNDYFIDENSEPYLIDWEDVPQFLDWYNENINDFFYGDTFFVFEDREMISVCRHEGGFFHLYIGGSLYPPDENRDEWLNQEKKAK